jgi:5-methylcytosine-specific restriction endonuclease McrA
MKWRAQSIGRVVAVLRTLAPITHVIISAPPRQSGRTDKRMVQTSLRDELVAAYGTPALDGTLQAQCAYCGRTEGSLVVDHILPRSRGGTKAWHNLVLACQSCNDRKGDRTPEEAGMPLRLPYDERAVPQRVRPYVQQTVRLVAEQAAGLDVRWSSIMPGDRHQAEVHRAGGTASQRGPVPLFLAKPIARPRKQRFSSRNYPLSTPVRPPYLQVGSTIKRRVRVNLGLAVWYRDGQVQTQVVREREQFPDGALAVRLGMLCQGRRANSIITGIVAAVHSTGRLTLRVPGTVTQPRVQWQRITISPRQHFRLISSDRVLFFAIRHN